ncbi:MAG: hypothetical protein ACRDHS_03035 [Actinomycetota bacterium]
MRSVVVPGMEHRQRPRPASGWTGLYGGDRPKVYREHGCDRRHRSFLTFAKCVWPRALWILGDGPFASVSWCGARPGLPRYRSGASVKLWETIEDAHKAKAQIDYTGCGGLCVRRHEVIQLERGTDAS